LLNKILLNPKKSKKSNKFSEYIKDTYGPTLYRSFFKKYTEKFLKIPANKVHSDWAITGINRSIIDKNAKGNSIFELLKSVLIPAPAQITFIYPGKRGFGYFSEKLADKIKQQGGSILTSNKIDKLDYPNSAVKIKNKKFAYSRIIWTGNLHDLGKLTGEKFTDITYLSTIFYNIIVKKDNIRQDQWIYYGDKNLSIVRVTIEKNIAPYLTQKGYNNLIVEKTCKFGDKIWQSAEKTTDKILKELVQVNLIDNTNQIKKVSIEKIKDTYPIYHQDYKKGFAQVARTINTKYPNIKLFGRTGAFWYNNSDHSITAALRMAKYLTGLENKEPNKENIFSPRKL